MGFMPHFKRISGIEVMIFFHPFWKEGRKFSVNSQRERKFIVYYGRNPPFVEGHDYGAYGANDRLWCVWCK